MNQTANLGSVLTAVEDAGLFVSLCTIQSPSQMPDALGQADLSDWTDVSGMIGIACMAAPRSVAHLSGTEAKAATFTAESSLLHVLLDGHYPAIRTRYRAVIDGTPYEILNVESDSQSIMTRLLCQEYSL